jgi:hypothetical protein
MTQPVVREYTTAEEALEAANGHLKAAIEEINRHAFPSIKCPIIQFAVRKPEPEPECPGWLQTSGVKFGDTVKLVNGNVGKVVLVDASGPEERKLVVDLRGRPIAYGYDGWPNNDSLCRYLEDIGLPRDSKVSDFWIAEIVRDKGRLSQITITNSQPEFDLHRFNHPPIVAGMEFE